MLPTSTKDLLVFAAGFVFQFWPILILVSPFVGGRSSWLGKMLFVWLLVLAIRIFLSANTPPLTDYSSTFHILPEPTYTTLFGVVGGVLVIFSLVQSFFRSRR